MGATASAGEARGDPRAGPHGDGLASREARIALVARLRERRAAIDEAILARVSDRWFERTGSDDPEYMAGLRAAGAAALDYGLAGVERWGERLEPVPVEVVEQARRAARAGVALETVLRRYFVGYAVFDDFMVREAERDGLLGPSGALREVLAIVSTLVDRLLRVVAGAYKGALEHEPSTDAAPARGEIAGDHRRERIVVAIVQMVSEVGLAGASVGLVSERARVSRATFYKLFPGGLEEGLTAVIDMGSEQLGALVSQALQGEESWRDRVRSALAAVLVMLDSRPELARVLSVETLRAGPVVLAHRERAVKAFRMLIVERIESEVPRASPLAAEGVLASVMEVVRARLSRPGSSPLIELLGPLVGLIVEHVEDRPTAVAEEGRARELARAIAAGEVDWALPASSAPAATDARLPRALGNPAARRLRECMLHLAAHPGASNSDVGGALGIPHKSQVSKLLSQLLAQDLAARSTTGPSAPNEWRLTPRGDEVARALAELELGRRSRIDEIDRSG